MVDLRAEGFAQLPNTTAPSGVYALLRGDTVLYISASKAIYGRIAEHYRARRRGGGTYVGVGEMTKVAIQFDRVLVKWCSHHEAEILETELVYRYRPEYNKKVVEPLRDWGIDLDALAESVGVSWSKEQELGERRRMMQHSSLRRSLVW